ncbi:MAG: hypothetical protein NZ901_04275 [Geminocystis sp.]|nr:hypothetical protein [Geminocystis sp.]HIK38142.1 hypothetical protein [Geminocystis sp. M7585_C2015_104]MCS7147389.1 hypothetical protein [Geminocystis sp.]MCX8079375.1 hypothetical protein [Geminocystis sp.]MDW8117079.1 hypothetical protein [Geminocystis sp.]
MRKSQTVLLSTMVALLVAPSFSLAQNPNNIDVQASRLTEALRKAAPNQRPNDGMYSPWQVLPGIIPSWTKQCLGKEMTPQQFDTDENAARQTVNCIVKRELNNQWKSVKSEQQAVRNVACWWMTGKYQGCNQGATANYVDIVIKYYQKAQ